MRFSCARCGAIGEETEAGIALEVGISGKCRERSGGSDPAAELAFLCPEMSKALAMTIEDMIRE